MSTSKKNIDKNKISSKARKPKEKKPSWIKTKKYIYKLFPAKYKLSGGWKSTLLLDDTRKVVDILLERKENTTTRNVRTVYREIYRFKHGQRFSRTPKNLSVSSLQTPKPDISIWNNPAMLETYGDYFIPRNFWEVYDFLTFWIAVDKDIYLVSPMVLGKDITLKGGSIVSYEDTFKPWVDYLNKQKDEEHESNPSAYEHAWYFKLKGDNIENGLYWSFKNQRWEVELISCDAEGVSYEYGWDTETGEIGAKQDYDFKKKIEPKEKEEELPPPPQQPTTPITNIDAENQLKIKQLEIESAERIKIAEIESKERLKAKQIESLERLFATGKISFDQYFDAQQKLLNS